MAYIILADSRRNKGEKVALVDRSRFKDQWWTERIEKAMIFKKKSAAEIQRSKLRYNNPKVFPLREGKIRLNQVEVDTTNRSSILLGALNRKLSQWHDDDWCES